MCKCQTWYKGINKIATSVVIFGTALPMKIARRFKHLPGIVRFQARGIGLHWNMPNDTVSTLFVLGYLSRLQRKMNISDHTHVTMLRIQAAMWKDRSGNTRQYMTKTAILMTARTTT